MCRRSQPRGLRRNGPLWAVSWHTDGAEKLGGHEVADLLRVLEIPTAGGTDQRQDRAGEVVGGPVQVDPRSEPSRIDLPPEVGQEEVGDERERLGRLRSEERQ